MSKRLIKANIISAIKKGDKKLVKKYKNKYNSLKGSRITDAKLRGMIRKYRSKKTRSRKIKRKYDEKLLKSKKAAFKTENNKSIIKMLWDKIVA